MKNSGQKVKCMLITMTMFTKKKLENYQLMRDLGLESQLMIMIIVIMFTR